MKVRAASLALLPSPPVYVEVIDRRRIGIPLVEGLDFHRHHPSASVPANRKPPQGRLPCGGLHRQPAATTLSSRRARPCAPRRSGPAQAA